MTPYDAQELTRRQRAVARCDLLLAGVHELIGDLERDGIPVPGALKNASAALEQAERELHEQAGNQLAHASALAQGIREPDRQAGTRLAERAETEARHLMELATSAAIQRCLLPWGVEQIARSLTEWALRQRVRA